MSARTAGPTARAVVIWLCALGLLAMHQIMAAAAPAHAAHGSSANATTVVQAHVPAHADAHVPGSMTHPCATSASAVDDSGCPGQTACQGLPTGSPRLLPPSPTCLPAVPQLLVGAVTPSTAWSAGGGGGGPPDLNVLSVSRT